MRVFLSCRSYLNRARSIWQLFMLALRMFWCNAPHAPWDQVVWNTLKPPQTTQTQCSRTSYVIQFRVNIIISLKAKSHHSQTGQMAWRLCSNGSPSKIWFRDVDWTPFRQQILFCLLWFSAWWTKFKNNIFLLNSESTCCKHHSASAAAIATFGK